MESLNYQVTIIDEGEWIHSQGTDFLFAFLKKSWSDQFKAKLGKAFTTGLTVPNKIKESVKKNSGQDVVNGLYIQDEAAMTKAMNDIPGMSQTGASRHHEEGEDIVTVITEKFFGAVLATLGGNVKPISTYLTSKMADFQAQLKETKVDDKFGTVIGLISGIPEFDVVTTTFKYVYSSASTASWVVETSCSSTQKTSYNYDYTVVDYLYNPSP